MRQPPLLLLCFVLAACEGGIGEQTPMDPAALLPEATGAVQASFQAGPWNAGEQTVWIRLTGVEGPVGAYQGRAEFDTGRLNLLSGEMTDAEGADVFGVLNTDTGSGGVVRFAGFSVEGFDVRDVVALRFRTDRPLVAGDVRLTLDVVGTAEGVEVSSDELSVVSEMRPLDKLEIAR